MTAFTMEALKRAAAKRPPGYLEDVLSRATVDGDRVTLTSEAYRELVNKYRGKTPGGPGAELKKLLSRLGFSSNPGCACNKRARVMDARGIPWCEQNVELICDWLQEESTKRKLPFVRVAGKALIHLAIRRAKKATSK